MTDEHNHSECDCGCDCEHDHSDDVYPPYFIVGIAGFVLVALVTIASSVAYFGVFMHDNNYSWDNGDIMYAVSWIEIFGSIIILLIAGYGFLRELHSESLFLTIIALSALVNGYLCVTRFPMGYADETYMMLDLLFGIAIILPSVVFALRNEFMFAIAGFSYAIASIACEFISPGSGVYAIFSAISGIIIAYIAIANLLYCETGKVLPLK